MPHVQKQVIPLEQMASRARRLGPAVAAVIKVGLVRCQAMAALEFREPHHQGGVELLSRPAIPVAIHQLHLLQSIPQLPAEHLNLLQPPWLRPGS
jgi:hypothetical protein